MKPSFKSQIAGVRAERDYYKANATELGKLVDTFNAKQAERSFRTAFVLLQDRDGKTISQQTVNLTFGDKAVFQVSAEGDLSVTCGLKDR